MSKARGKEYGKDATTNPAVSKYATLAAGDGAGSVSWQEVNGPVIKAAITSATEDGCAIIFSKTSDGGALSITVLAGTERIKKYAKSSELAESILTELVQVSST